MLSHVFSMNAERFYIQIFLSHLPQPEYAATVNIFFRRLFASLLRIRITKQIILCLKRIGKHHCFQYVSANIVIPAETAMYRIRFRRKIINPKIGL